MVKGLLRGQYAVGVIEDIGVFAVIKFVSRHITFSCLLAMSPSLSPALHAGNLS